jgi:hypothetical protein
MRLYASSFRARRDSTPAPFQERQRRYDDGPWRQQSYGWASPLVANPMYEIAVLFTWPTFSRRLSSP